MEELIGSIELKIIQDAPLHREGTEETHYERHSDNIGEELNHISKSTLKLLSNEPSPIADSIFIKSVSGLNFGVTTIILSE